METKLKLGVMYKEHGLVMDAYTITTDLYLATIASPGQRLIAVLRTLQSSSFAFYFSSCVIKDA